MYKSLLLAAVSFLPISAAAQSATYVPFKYATVDAGTYTAYPFGLSGPCHLQYLYSSELVGPAVVPTSQIAFRGAGGRSAAAKTGVDLEIVMSTTSVDPWSPNASFAANHGSNKSTAFTRKTINLPAQPAKTPNDFVTIFKLDKSFIYLKSAGNLLIDYIVYGQPAGAYTHNTSYTVSGVNTNVGTACGGVSLSVPNASKLNNTSTLDYNLSGAPANGIAIHFLGTSSLPSGVPLPFGGCKLYQNILSALVLPVSASGTVNLQYLLPSNSRDIVVFGQYVALNPTITQLSATQSIQTKIGGLDAHARIYSTSSATVSSGSIQLGVGIVTELK